jgi:hypothetical protein
MYSQHAAEYDQAVINNNWSYKLLADCGDDSTHKNACNSCDHRVLRYSSANFLDNLVYFVVADDQVSLSDIVSIHTLMSPLLIRVVECPEFR